jgi:two-component system cell cycle response regulator CtrA
MHAVVAVESKMRVLLVENDVAGATNLTAYLADEGLAVEISSTGEEALELVRHYEFDIMLLNLMLPDLNGSTVISRMRTARRNTPILGLSSSVSAQPTIKALAAGADDVVARTIDRAELLARMRAVVRRSRGYSQPTLQVGDLTLSLEDQIVTVHGSEVRLTGKEFAILQLLMLRKNMVMTKEAILAQLYGGMDEPELKIIDVFVCKIRSKLAKVGAPNVIGTVWGRGYTVRDVTRDPYVPAPPRAPEPVQRKLPSSLLPA